MPSAPVWPLFRLARIFRIPAHPCRTRDPLAGQQRLLPAPPLFPPAASARYPSPPAGPHAPKSDMRVDARAVCCHPLCSLLCSLSYFCCRSSGDPAKLIQARGNLHDSPGRHLHLPSLPCWLECVFAASSAWVSRIQMVAMRDVGMVSPFSCDPSS